ncbi:hypothetical protein [Lysinibacillus xylanilyticus]|uniref:hypothetical protein n=1 Tax=Lysinibacillus xylanilyticus TaxID=582475 RepID=UPI003D97F048
MRRIAFRHSNDSIRRFDSSFRHSDGSIRRFDSSFRHSDGSIRRFDSSFRHLDSLPSISLSFPSLWLFFLSLR